jgi:hypothetical protein
MAIVVIGGSARGVGKTTLVCGLITALPEWSWMAVKITSHVHGKAQPVWEEKEPGQGTDTARFLAAGAQRAFLLTAPEISDLEPVFHQLHAECGTDSNLIIESNRILDIVRPALCLMVQGDADPANHKLSFRQALRMADAIVVRADANRDLSEAWVGERASGPMFRLASFECISPEMRSWVEQRLRSSGK